MFWLVLALAIAVLTALVIGYLRRNQKRPVAVIVAHDLSARIRSATKAFKKAEPWQPASSTGAPEAAAAVETALIAREPRRALELAELALVASEGRPPDPAARVWLAWALCASGQPIGALDQLAQLELAALDPGGARALATYVTARAEHLKFEHGVGAVEAVPPLVTAADVAVVTLGRGRGGAAWLTGGGDAQLSAAEVKAAVGEHREITGRCLEGALDALSQQPGFVDAAYLVARLAVKAGFVDEASSLFDTIAPRMVGRPDLEAFERDRRDFLDPSTAVANARIKAAAPSAKRSRSLKVL
jgi:hypothetical protein